MPQDTFNPFVPQTQQPQDRLPRPTKPKEIGVQEVAPNYNPFAPATTTPTPSVTQARKKTNSVDEALREIDKYIPKYLKDKINESIAKGEKLPAGVIDEAAKWTPDFVKSSFRWTMRQLDKPGAMTRAAYKEAYKRVPELASLGTYAGAFSLDPTSNIGRMGTIFKAMKGQIKTPTVADVKAIAKAGKQGLIEPKSAPSGKQLIELTNPEFAKAHPIQAEVRGALLEFVLDPTSYPLGGAGLLSKGIQVPVQTAKGIKNIKLSGRGVQALKRMTRELEGGTTLVKKLPTGKVETETFTGFMEAAEAQRKAELAAKTVLSKQPGKFTKNEINKIVESANTKSSVDLQRDIDLLVSERLATKAERRELHKLRSGKAQSVNAQAQKQANVEQKLLDILENKPAKDVYGQLDKIPSIDPTTDAIIRAKQLEQINRAGKDIKDLERFYLRPAHQDEITRTAAQDLGNLISQSPQMRKDLTKRGIDLGTTYLKTKIADLVASPFVQDSVLGSVPGVFIKDWQRNPEIVKGIREYENRLDQLNSGKQRVYDYFAKQLSQESLEKVGKAGWELQGATNAQIKKLGRNLTDAEANEVIESTLKRMGLNADEHAMLTRQMQSFREEAILNQQLGIAHEYKTNYHPQIYKLTDNPKQFNFIMRNNGESIRQAGGRGLTGQAPFQKARKFNSVEEAVAAGYEPEYNAALLYAMRWEQQQKKLATKQLEAVVKETTGLNLDQIPNTTWGKRLKDDIVALGEGKTSAGFGVYGEDAGRVAKFLDKTTQLFRSAATRYQPAFAIKQAISNPALMAMVQGAKAMKSFDPRAILDAAMFYAFPTNTTRKLPAFLDNFFASGANQGTDAVLASRVALNNKLQRERLTSYADNYMMETALGQKIQGTDLLDELERYGIVRNSSPAGTSMNFGEYFKGNTASRMEREIASKFKAESSPVKSAIGQLTKFWNHSGMTEDYARTIAYLNARRMGHTAEDAAKLVNKALFDYSHGLSQTERTWIRPILGFYTFQRFGIPAAFRGIVNQPGVAVNMERVLGTVNKLISSGEELNPSEQEVFGKHWLMDQPYLGGWKDGSGRMSYNVMNNLNPADVLNIFKFDKHGKPDLRATAREATVASMVPYIRVPLEILLNKKFFGDRVLSEAVRDNRVITPEFISNALPEQVKSLMRFETRIVDGKPITYVNPYATYVAMEFIPALRKYVNPWNESKGILGTSKDLAWSSIKAFAPTGTKVKLDLKNEAERQENTEYKELTELLKNIKGKAERGELSQTEDLLNDYLELFNNYQKDYEKRRAFPIRGTGEPVVSGLPNTKQ